MTKSDAKAGRVPMGQIVSIDYASGKVVVQMDTDTGFAHGRDLVIDIGDRVVLVPALTDHHRRALKHVGIGWR